VRARCLLVLLRRKTARRRRAAGHGAPGLRVL